ncbi:zinc finger protein CONSTANS-LIKE 6 [Cucumis melo var. makuwa]|nr:zinc finger protein CONSTANS-LIKE 6 [Cucumis melo]ADN34083.1 zinc finger (B-box type) family protein [Cucumis melo subsp. melo]KAA0063912.1 zinc finger protein CONSTANS-LIKE 6 [Cucumis melo var. makuwa]TYK11320.1 zinc finger protein CONSTANS-LIKE 6 [Cucumis melo var. makuwa]
MMSRKNIANAVGGKTARACDSCVRRRARWYCAADDAFLCQSCDTTVHSANPLARRHQRLRLNSSNSPTLNSPSWVSGFTRKPRTPRPRPKSNDLIHVSVVPETDDATSHEDEHLEDQLLYRVPTLDVNVSDFGGDVEKNLEREWFDIEEELGFVKVEESCWRIGEGFDSDQVDFLMDFEEIKIPPLVVGVKNERHEDNEDDESGITNKNKRRVLSLRLDCEAVIAAWGNLQSPWTNGQRPDFDPDQPWPNSMEVCEVRYGQRCGEHGLRTAAMGDGGREARVSRYREKRRTRLFSKKIRYEVRKLNAEKRPRMKGRFVKRTPFPPQPTLPFITIN